MNKMPTDSTANDTSLAGRKNVPGQESIPYNDSVENNRRQEPAELVIVEYNPKYKDAFRQLSSKWIEQHWELEPHDIEVLENPEKHIIAPGGHIFVALYHGAPVGVCALCKMPCDSEYDYELAKLAVDAQIQGKGVGRRLCETVIDKARELGGKTLFLEGNTILVPSIALYRKLGFKELPECHFSYARGDIQMVMWL